MRGRVVRGADRPWGHAGPHFAHLQFERLDSSREFVDDLVELSDQLFLVGGANFQFNDAFIERHSRMVARPEPIDHLAPGWNQFALWCV